jgi:phospholipase/carboxylesterase
METTLEGPAHAPLSCGKAVHLVVLLHARGTDGNHVIEIGIDWGATLNKAKFVAPHGPLSDDATPDGRQWFGTLATDPQQLTGDIRTAAAMVDAYLDEVLASHHLPDSHLAIVGFGQGGTMALHVGLRRAKPVGSIVAVSGVLHDAELLAEEIRSRPPTLLVHGAADPEVTEASMMNTRAALAALDVPVQTLTKPGDYHGLDEEGIDLTADFLRRSLVERSSGQS